MTPSDQVLVLEEEGGAEPAGLHQGAVVDVVLVQGPLRPGRQAEVVGAQPYYNPRRTCGGGSQAVSTWPSLSSPKPFLHVAGRVP